MAISAIAPVSGLGSLGGISPISSLGSLGSLSPTGTTGSTNRSAAGAVTSSFSDALRNVQNSIDNASKLSEQLATGELTDIHEFTVAASKAQLGVQLTVAMRNQLLGAFQEVMRTQM